MGATDYRAHERNAMYTSQSCGKVLEHPGKQKIIASSPSLEEVALRYASKGGHQAEVYENVVYPFAFHPVQEAIKAPKKLKWTFSDCLYIPVFGTMAAIACFGLAVGKIFAYDCPDKIEDRHP